MRALTGAANAMSGGFKSFNASAGNMRIVGLEVVHITRSISTQLAMGVSPLRAFTAEIGRMATAAQYAGGVGGLAKAVAGMIAPFAAAAAGAGLLATAFLGVKQAADSTDLKAYIDTLGLTDAQIKQLKDTTVTWGDVTSATFQVLAEKAGTSAGAISGAFSSSFKSIGEFGKFSVAVILGAFGAMVQGVHDLIVNLPAIVGGGIAAAANLGIAALEKMVNLGVAGLNKLGSTINSVLGTNFGQVAEVSLGRVQSNFAGTMSAIGANVSSTFHRIFNSTQGTFDQISARAVSIRQDNLRAQADALRSADKATGASHKAAAAHRDQAKAVKDLKDAYTDLIGTVNAFDTKHPAKLPEVDLKSLIPDLPDLGAELARQQANTMQWADAFSGAITEAVTGAKSLKDAFSDLATSIIHDLIEMSVRMLIFRALSSIFGGGLPSFPSASLPQGADSGLSGIPGFASGGSGTFGGFGGVDSNVLSMNGSPIMRVSRGEHFAVSNDNTSGVTINQTIAPNFAGNAATQDDLVKMAIITKNAAIDAVRQSGRRSS